METEDLTSGSKSEQVGDFTQWRWYARRLSLTLPNLSFPFYQRDPARDPEQIVGTSCAMKPTNLQYTRFSQLSLLECAVFLENASPLGRRWLATLPTQPLLRITNFEVAANLMIRSLIPGMHADCPRFSRPLSIGHHEISRRSTAACMLAATTRSNWGLPQP